MRSQDTKILSLTISHQSSEKIRISFEQLEPERDMEEFVRDYGSGNFTPDPPKFVSVHQSGDRDVSATRVSLCSVFSVLFSAALHGPSYACSTTGRKARGFARGWVWHGRWRERQSLEHAGLSAYVLVCSCERHVAQLAFYRTKRPDRPDRVNASHLLAQQHERNWGANHVGNWRWCLRSQSST